MPPRHLLLLTLLSGCDLWLKGDAVCDRGGHPTGIFADADGDGFGDPSRPLECDDIDESVLYVENAEDCDDAVYNTESGVRIWYLDEDYSGDRRD